MLRKDFWKDKKISDLSEEEWEAVCDGCGKCCLFKTGIFKIRFTDIACRLLDIHTARCKDYANRHHFVPSCLKLTPKNLKKARKWLPKTCSYLWLMEKGMLPPWHPFVSGKKNSVHTMGLSVRDRAVSESPELIIEEHIVSWDDL